VIQLFFSQTNPLSGVFKFLPEFILKKYVLSFFPLKELEANIADTLDFMVERVETLKQKTLASRVTLNSTAGPLEINNFPLDSQKISIIDVLDESFIPESIREDLYKVFPEAKQARLKCGGDFPFVSVSDEVNMFIEVHLRAMGYETGDNIQIDDQENQIPTENNQQNNPEDIKENNPEDIKENDNQKEDEEM